MFGLSGWHIVLVLVVFVLLFGAGRISGLMGDIAKGLRSFKKGLTDEDEEAHRETELVAHAGGKGRVERREVESDVAQRIRKRA